MKSLKDISKLVKDGTSMVTETQNSVAMKKVKADVKEKVESLKKSTSPKKLAKYLLVKRNVPINMTKDMLNSKHAKFIKNTIKESDEFKKLVKNLDKASDMIPFPIKREFVNYWYWLSTNKTLFEFALSIPPVTLIESFLKYPWMFEYTKANAMITSYMDKRTGANFYAMHQELDFLVKKQAEGLINAINHPEKLVINQNTTAVEILMAMGFSTLCLELPTLLGKLDQWSYLTYIEQGEEVGLSVDTCSLPKSALGIAVKGEVLPSAAVLMSNYPCDAGMAQYNYLEEVLGRKVYSLNMPYDLRNDDYLEPFLDEIKNMIKFFEEEAGGVMDWDKLKEICENYNQIVEYERERWEMLKLDNPPLSNDVFQQSHYFNFSYLANMPGAVHNQRRLLEIAQKALAKGMPSFENMRFRTVMWNPAPSAWGHWYNWLERCWGIGVVMDLESSGPMWNIDTTTRDTMLLGLAKRHMWQTMARHTKGPMSNYMNDFYIALNEMRPDFVLYPKPIGCKNVMTMEAMVKEECRRRNMPVCSFKMDLQDNRVASRQQIRDEVSKFMQDIMHAEPLDPSLLILDDCNLGRW